MSRSKAGKSWRFEHRVSGKQNAKQHVPFRGKMTSEFPSKENEARQFMRLACAPLGFYAMETMRVTVEEEADGAAVSG